MRGNERKKFRLLALAKWGVVGLTPVGHQGVKGWVLTGLAEYPSHTTSGMVGRTKWFAVPMLAYGFS
jgi:hypothetical protein